MDDARGGATAWREYSVEPSAGERAGRAAEPERLDAALARHYLNAEHALVPGNGCTLLRDGIEVYPRMLDAIRGARRSIRLETYMFIDDAVGQLFGRALVEAAQRGVRVKVLYDALGSWGSRRAFFKSLRAQGVDIRAFKPFTFSAPLGRLMRRDHRKLLIVDGEVAFVGGVNIASHWAPKGEGGGWRDDVVRIEGPVVQRLERRFCASWRMQVRERLRALTRRQRPERGPPKGDVSLAVLSSRRTIHQAYLRAISQATTSVRIAAAYFIPDRKMMAALRAAAERGVEVSLILAGESDHAWVKYASRAFYDRLLSWGVKVHEWCEGVLHSKTAVVDGVWGTVGSFNLERMSLLFNHEVNVVFVDRATATRLERSFLEDRRMCRAIEPAAWRARPLWQKVLEKFCFFFRKAL